MYTLIVTHEKSNKRKVPECNAIQQHSCVELQSLATVVTVVIYKTGRMELTAVLT